nr:hypothetical protein BaRGS_011420 [Batillaria attramentaria]
MPNKGREFVDGTELRTPGTVRATSGKVVPFHTVILNTGTVYNSSSSLFTAPRDGDYFFILNVDVSKDHDCISIRRNGGTVIVADRDDTCTACYEKNV